MKTVLQHFETLPYGEFRDFVFNNLDDRYLSYTSYTLNDALTFGVKCPNKGDWNKIEQFINNQTKPKNEIWK